ncbi:MAG: DUF5659 domain-containing protein [Patescibacteria group bacterium]|jgi:hypothetical protein
MTQGQKSIPPEEIRHIPLDNQEHLLRSFDMGACSALLCSGFELVTLDKTNPRKALFVFKRKEGIDEAINKYWAGELKISALQYFDTLKMLKNRLYSE